MDEIDLESPQMRMSMGSDWFPLKPNIVKNIVSYCKKCKKLFNCVHHHKNWKISKILNVDSSQSKPC